MHSTEKIKDCVCAVNVDEYVNTGTHQAGIKNDKVIDFNSFVVEIILKKIKNHR